MDRVAWQAIVHGVTQSWTQLKQLNMHIEKINTISFFFFFASELSKRSLGTYKILLWRREL